MSKIEQLKAILDKYQNDNYSYIDNGDESVKLIFNQEEVKGEVSISDVGILNLFLAILGGIDNLGKKSSQSCEITFFFELINFMTKKCGKKKDIKINQKDLTSLIIIASFLKNLIENQTI